jgi:hypothetical protein
MPAFDRRSDDPRKDFGIHCAEMRMKLHGNRGVVEFILFTNWQLPHITEKFENKIIEEAKRGSFDEAKTMFRCFFRPNGAELVYHSPVPLYEGQMKISCDYFHGGCYFGGSCLAAEPLLDLLVAEGSDAVWKKIEEYYVETFC